MRPKGNCPPVSIARLAPRERKTHHTSLVSQTENNTHTNMNRLWIEKRYLTPLFGSLQCIFSIYSALPPMVELASLTTFAIHPHRFEALAKRIQGKESPETIFKALVLVFFRNLVRAITEFSHGILPAPFQHFFTRSFSHPSTEFRIILQQSQFFDITVNVARFNQKRPSVFYWTNCVGNTTSVTSHNGHFRGHAFLCVYKMCSRREMMCKFQATGKSRVEYKTYKTDKTQCFRIRRHAERIGRSKGLTQFFA